MHADISPSEIVIRLAMALAAGALLGFNRGQHGRPAGLRTTVLVCMTATASLILANLLMGMHGRGADSFVSMDVMRLPLGVLTGVGFIGAGAIIHRADMVVGVTTAATLWYSTMIGFYIGAGEILWGAVLTAIGLVVLAGFDWVEERLPSLHRGTLIVRTTAGGPDDGEISSLILARECRIAEKSVKFSSEGCERRYVVRWWRRDAVAPSIDPPDFVAKLAARTGVREVEWS